jgi:hypothetical protein
MVVKNNIKTRALSAGLTPGFTAEASLSSTEYRYGQAASLVSVTDSGKITPVFCYKNTDGQTATCCDFIPVSSYFGLGFFFCYQFKAFALSGI